LDLDILSLPEAYFSGFDHMVRRQLDPVWPKVGWRTKALVRDLGELRKLVKCVFTPYTDLFVHIFFFWKSYLLTYDCLQFHSFCEMLIASNDSKEKGLAGVPGERSLWIVSDAANIIFQTAKRRCFLQSTLAPALSALGTSVGSAHAPINIDDDPDADAWDALDEAEGRTKEKPVERMANGEERPKWLPSEIEPVLEELPKWTLLAEVLDEIEGEIVRIESMGTRRKFVQSAFAHARF
jgi:DNA excision repair protein ERCC-4